VIFEQNHTVSGSRFHIDVSLYRFVYTIDTMDHRDTFTMDDRDTALRHLTEVCQFRWEDYLEAAEEKRRLYNEGRPHNFYGDHDGEKRRLYNEDLTNINLSVSSAWNVWVKARQRLEDRGDMCDNCLENNGYVSQFAESKGWYCQNCKRIRENNVAKSILEYKKTDFPGYEDMLSQCDQCDEWYDFDDVEYDETEDRNICVGCHDRQYLPWVLGGWVHTHTHE